MRAHGLAMAILMAAGGAGAGGAGAGGAGAGARPAADEDAPRGEVAMTTLKDAGGRVVGDAVLRETPNGILIDATFSRMLAGTHALHIHEKGVCEPPFESAGGHLRGRGERHGYHSAAGPHAGDLPNIHVPETAQLHVELFVPELKLRAGDLAIIDADGAALMVHEHADDYRTDPAGDAGRRIACGVIR